MWILLTALCVIGWVATFVWASRNSHELRREIDHQRKLRAEVEAKQYREVASRHAEQEALFNSMIEGVLLLDRDGKIRLINRAFEAIFAIQTNIRGQTSIEALRLHELEDLLKILEAGTVHLSRTLTLPGLEGRELRVNGAVVLDRDGQRQGTILVFHDVTRLKQLENTRQEFVANVSHELRTPLSLIKGYVETLIDGAKDNPAVAMKFLQTIEKHADRLTFLIEDLLTIARLESGQIVLNFQMVPPRSIAQRVLDDLQTKADSKSIVLKNQVPESLVARADTDRIQQVISNLVDNAIKYSYPESEVILSGRLADDMVEITVHDEGPGIPAESTERIFERFYRVDKARSREQGGTGLGLAIVKHIVQSHGGQVWVKTKVGKGSGFYFTLPVK
jgi:two-component system phosphate regulon sensor histidine kinase PhoR